MKETVFVDIDTQFDFMDPSGALYVPGAGKFTPKLKRLSQFAAKNDILIISSADTHKKKDPEFKQFPAHCLSGSRGQKKIRETLIGEHCFLPRKVFSRGELFKKVKGFRQVILEKDTYDVFVNPNLGRILKPFKAVFIYGVALDYCVKYAVLGLL